MGSICTQSKRSSMHSGMNRAFSREYARRESRFTSRLINSFVPVFLLVLFLAPAMRILDEENHVLGQRPLASIQCRDDQVD